MRCLSCNKILNDFESTRKYASSETYIDMCMSCFGKSEMEEVLIIDRADLLNEVNQEPPLEDQFMDEDDVEFGGCGNGPCG